MKKTNIFKAHFVPPVGIIAFAAIIGFSITACGGDDEGVTIDTTSGRLTVTGLSDYAGQYVALTITGGGIGLQAYDSASADRDQGIIKKAALVPASGTVELKVWEMGSAPGNYEAWRNYTGSGTFEGTILISSSENQNYGNTQSLPNRVTATFAGGIGTAAYE